jgi:hypothetical protein
MNKVRLASITPQRASVVAHCQAGWMIVYNTQMASRVSSALYQVLNRLLRIHASGPTTVTGGFISVVVISAFHQLNA